MTVLYIRSKSALLKVYQTRGIALTTQSGIHSLWVTKVGTRFSWHNYCVRLTDAAVVVSWELTILGNYFSNLSHHARVRGSIKATFSRVI